MQQEVYDMALLLGGKEESLSLRVLCDGVVASLLRRLRPDVPLKEAWDALVLGGAWLALSSASLEGSAVGDVESFSAGTFSVRHVGGLSPLERANALKHEANQLLAPFLTSCDFAFLGVPG